MRPWRRCRLPEGAGTTFEGRTAADNQTVRSVFVVGPDKKIKAMLTFCVRGERFSDGHWAEMIEKGHIRRLLERLNEIAEQLKSGG